MSKIEFMKILIANWPVKVTQSSHQVIEKMYEEYIKYCNIESIDSRSANNLIVFIEMCKYEEMPISTRHDIYRAAQTQLLDEMLFLKENKYFVRDFIEILNSGIHDRERSQIVTIEFLLDTILTHLDHYEDDKSIDSKLTKYNLKYEDFSSPTRELQ